LRALRVGFAGTPPFAARALQAVLDAGFPVPLVLTQPDRPRGRGLALAPSAVKALAAARGIPVLQPASLRDEASRAAAVAVPLDVLLVAAYGLILPPAVLAWPRHGCLNIHASLLPRWRGAAPVAHAILAGDTMSGVTIMQMDAGLDTGPAISAVPVTIGPDDTAGTLTERLAGIGAGEAVQVLAHLEASGHLRAEPQSSDGATYASKITRADAVLDWSQPAAALARAVRAFDPVPGATFSLAADAVKVWEASVVDGSGAPGVILRVTAEALDVACGEGALRLRSLQPPNGRRMSGGAFAAGRRLSVGRPVGQA
jgi:methionyl-tRNA formyltransferase